MLNESFDAAFTEDVQYSIKEKKRISFTIAE
jgi:hypothetical protein